MKFKERVTAVFEWLFERVKALWVWGLSHRSVSIPVVTFVIGFLLGYATP